MSSISLVSTRRSPVLADLIPGARSRDVLLVAGGAVLTGLVAQLSFPVPGSPVPVTGQTFAVLGVGAALGWQRGIASMALYMVAGVLGVPWFAGHSSGVHFPTLGYIVGFVVAAGLVGWLASRGSDRRPLSTIGTMIAGNLAIYLIGASWLMVDLHVGAATAWSIGIRDYLVGDAAKILLAGALLPATWAGLGRRP